MPDAFLDVVPDVLDGIKIGGIGRPEHSDDVELLESQIGVLGLVARGVIFHQSKLRMCCKVFGNDAHNMLTIRARVDLPPCAVLNNQKPYPMSRYPAPDHARERVLEFEASAMLMKNFIWRASDVVAVRTLDVD